MNGILPDLEVHLSLDYDELSSSQYITWEMVINNLQKPWNLEKLSRNPIITWDIIENTPFLRWHWPSITINKNITFNIICNNIQYPWNFNILQSILSKDEFEYLITLKNNYVDDYSDNDSYDDSNPLYLL